MPLTYNRYKSCAVRFEAAPGYSGALLTVDAGAKKAGVAAWVWDDVPENGRLVTAATVRAPTDEELPRAIEEWSRFWRYSRSTFYTVVERPKKRPNKRRYHADLQRLLDFIQATAQVLGPWTLQLYPEEWKAGVGSTLKSRGKEPHHRRLRTALSEAEQALFDRAGPDGKDAVGIGLFVLGRTGRGGKRCPPTCDQCSQPATEPHTCPYKEDIHGDYTDLCQCCDACVEECASDI